MKLGFLLGYSGQQKMDLPMELIQHCESLGYDSLWTAEAYGSDAVTTAAWVLAQTKTLKVGTAIMQIPGRSPANTAMTALTLHHMTGGRFILGLGPSGPQVAEGWHGQPYGNPMQRIKEYITIVRKIFAREEPVSFDGECFQLPYRGEGSVGLGKPLKSILGAADIPIYTAAFTPAGVRTAGEVADGFFPVWMDPNRADLFAGNLEKGFANSERHKSTQTFETAPFVTVRMGDDMAECQAPVRQSMALYIGGMGAREKNFYNDYAKKLGFEDAAVKIQDLFLSGQKAEAEAAIPDELMDAVGLIGPEGRVREKLQDWKAAGLRRDVGTMCIGGLDKRSAEVVAEELL